MILIGGVPGSALSQEVYWGGVGFLSSKDQKQLTPNTSQLLCRNRECPPDENIDLAARRYLLEGAAYDNFKLTNALVGTHAVEGVMMAPLITQESVGITRLTTKGKPSYLHVYRIFASLVFFEFGTGRFMVARPVILRLTDILDHRANPEEQYVAFVDLVTSEKYGMNLFRSLYEKGKSVNPFLVAEKYAQITRIDTTENVEAVFPDSFDLGAWKAQVAQFLEVSLVEDTGAPLIPSMSEGEANRNLKATFADGSRKIVLPEPAFSIGLDVRKFGRFGSIDGPQETVCHAVAIDLSVSDSFGDDFLNIPFSRTQSSCGVVPVGTEFDDPYQFRMSLLTLLNQVSKQFKGKPDKAFLKKSAGKKSKEAAKQIKKVRNEIFKTGL